MFELHYHHINAFKTCPRMYRYAYVDNLVPKTPSSKLVLGTGFHIGVGAYYATNRNEEEALDAFRRWAEDEGVIEADPELVSLGESMLCAYIDYARRNDFFNVEAVEVSFKVPVWAPNGRPARGVRHVGTFDGIIRDPYGRLRLREFKTAQTFPSEDYLRLDEQAGYYLLAANQLFDEEVDGVLFEFVRKVNPSRAREEIVRRYYIVHSRPSLLNLRDRLYRDWLRIKRERHFDPSPGQHCLWKCGYRMLCLAEQDGIDLQYIIEAYYTTRDESKPSWAERLMGLLNREEVDVCVS